jgi:hypothetical protein
MNDAGWTKTHAPGAEHALIGGRHYVVSSRGTWPNPSFSAGLLGEEGMGSFDTIQDAKGFCEADAASKVGHCEYGVLGNEWGDHETVTRTVG